MTMSQTVPIILAVLAIIALGYLFMANDYWCYRALNIFVYNDNKITILYSYLCALLSV